MTRRTSPTARTLAALRKRGVIAGVVERWNPHAGPFGIRQDFLGFVDLIALDTDRRTTTAIQATSGGNGNAMARLRKITTECSESARTLLVCGWHIEIWAWRRLKLKRGAKAVRWRPVVREVTFADFVPPGAPNASDAILCDLARTPHSGGCGSCDIGLEDAQALKCPKIA